MRRKDLVLKSYIVWNIWEKNYEFNYFKWDIDDLPKMGTKIMIKELKKLCVCFFICIFFCLSCKTEVTKYIQSESEHTSIVWIGSFANADEIENPQYLWAYYNTTDGCPLIL